jgi:hypothetical protein
MIVSLRKPSMTEAVFQVIIGLLLIWSLWDLHEIMGPACAASPKPPDCYRWGEGPFAEYWSSQSRDNYWKFEMVQNGILALALCLPFFIRGRWMAFFLIVSSIASGWWNIAAAA